MIVFVIQKLSIIEEWCQDKVVCFGKKIAETKFRTPKTVLCSSPDEDDFCSLANKHDRRMAPR
jgi:hypothetical protein